MLSYRHGFHAGNFADILKHYCLFKVLNYYNRKDKPYLYLDAHGGAGLYDLQDEYAMLNKEYVNGYQRLLSSVDLPDELSVFRQFLQECCPSDSLYPGSPLIAANLLRAKDTLQVCELHSRDYQSLQENLQAVRKRRCLINKQDGYVQLLAQMPPVQNRSVVLIDPAYEDKQEYRRLIQVMEKSLHRFSQGSYLIWYPLLERAENQMFQSLLPKLYPDNYLDVKLIINPEHQGYGMFGCGMYLINPPYNLADELQSLESVFTDLLGETQKSQFIITLNAT